MKRRKLLVAAIGVASINYAACDGPFGETSGNLVAPEIVDTGVEDTGAAETATDAAVDGDATDGG